MSPWIAGLCLNASALKIRACSYVADLRHKAAVRFEVLVGPSDSFKWVSVTRTTEADPLVIPEHAVPSNPLLLSLSDQP